MDTNGHKMTALELTDGYKLGHRNQYPEGTQDVYATWIARSNRHMPAATDGAVVFGLQYFMKEYLIKRFKRDFFDRDVEEVCRTWNRRIGTFLGRDNIVGDRHVRELHGLGYLPLEIKALPEGALCPVGVPMLSVHATDERFFWLVNFLETIISNTIWLPCTSATAARLYKKELLRHAELTGWDEEQLDALGFCCHDFSMRGMGSLESSITSGMAHLTSFCGSETVPAICALEEYYHADADRELVAATVPATEHSVMCAGSRETELDTFRRILSEIYPCGFVSIVSDTWDYWRVIREYIPALKDLILARNGRFVVRPDSGNPADIICGMQSDDVLLGYSHEEFTGTYECLWNIFGGRVNKKGYRVLDPHIGIIYGDSITLELQKEIYRRLEQRNFAATNLVLGIGSFTYQYATRDCLGFAMKSSWCKIGGQGFEIFKDPKTGDGTKKSLRGLCCVRMSDDGKFAVVDRCSEEDEKRGELVTVFRDGEILREYTLGQIREIINRSLKKS